jgi:hypothetical protein
MRLEATATHEAAERAFIIQLLRPTSIHTAQTRSPWLQIVVIGFSIAALRECFGTCELVSLDDFTRWMPITRRLSDFLSSSSARMMTMLV